MSNGTQILLGGGRILADAPLGKGPLANGLGFGSHDPDPSHIGLS